MAFSATGSGKNSLDKAVHHNETLHPIKHIISPGPYIEEGGWDFILRWDISSVWSNVNQIHSRLEKFATMSAFFGSFTLLHLCQVHFCCLRGTIFLFPNPSE